MFDAVCVSNLLEYKDDQFISSSLHGQLLEPNISGGRKDAAGADGTHQEAGSSRGECSTGSREVT